MGEDFWSAVAGWECFIIAICLVSIVMITRALEARELELKNLKRKIQGIKETVKRL